MSFSSFNTQKIKHELELETRARSKTEFDVSKSIRLVLKFQEKDVDKCFIHFEKIAEHQHQCRVTKTYQKVLAHFFWSEMKQDIVNYCRSCNVCQVVVKPNHTIPRAALKPIHAFDEAFIKVILYCVGPLPKTKAGNQYLLTM